MLLCLIVQPRAGLSVMLHPKFQVTLTCCLCVPDGLRILYRVTVPVTKNSTNSKEVCTARTSHSYQKCHLTIHFSLYTLKGLSVTLTALLVLSLKLEAVSLDPYYQCLSSLLPLRSEKECNSFTIFSSSDDLESLQWSLPYNCRFFS